MAIEVITKPRAEYLTAAYAALGLPKAPAIMIDDEVLVEGRDIAEQELKTIIGKHLTGRRTREALSNREERRSSC